MHATLRVPVCLFCCFGSSCLLFIIEVVLPLLYAASDQFKIPSPETLIKYCIYITANAKISLPQSAAIVYLCILY